MNFSKVHARILFLHKTFKLIGIFKTKRINGDIWLVLLLIAVRTSGLIHTFTLHGFPHLFSFKFSFFSIIITTITIYFCGILLMNITDRYRFFDSPSYLPAALFFIFSAFIPENFSLDWWILSLVLVLLASNKIIKAYQLLRPERNYFDAGFLFGIVWLIQPQFFLLFVALIISTFFIVTPKFSNIIITAISFCMPIAFFSTYLFATSQLNFFEDQFDQLNQFFLFNRPFRYVDTSFLLNFFLFIWLISTAYWFRRIPYLSGYQLPILQYSSLFSFFILTTAFLFLPLHKESLLILYISILFILSFRLFTMNKFLANLLFILLTGFALLYPYIKDIKLNL